MHEEHGAHQRPARLPPPQLAGATPRHLCAPARQGHSKGRSDNVSALAFRVSEGVSDATASPIHVTTAPPPLLPARGIEPRAHCCSGIASRQLYHSPLSLPLSPELSPRAAASFWNAARAAPAWAWNFPRRTTDVAFFFSEAFLLNQDLIWQTFARRRIQLAGFGVTPS